MKSLHIASAALNQTPLDWEGNFQRCRKAILEAQEGGVDLLCLPELCISGYGCEDMFMAQWVLKRAEEYLLRLAEVAGHTRVIAGLPYRYKGMTYNTAAVIGDSRVFGLVPKQFLANDGIHYETRWFSPWKEDTNTSVEVGSHCVPFGALLFCLNDVSFGIEICEDAWVSDRPARKYIEEGADLICNPSASHFSLLKYKKRIATTLSITSMKPDVYYLYANLLGNEAGRAIYDGSSFIAQGEKLIARAPRFSFREVELVSAEIDVQEPKRSLSGESEVVILDDSRTREGSIRSSTGDRIASFELSPGIKEEEFTRAVALGMFDYMRKSRSKGFVISLSGGADSSACACLAKLAFSLAENQLGRTAFRRMSHASEEETDFLRKYLTLCYLKTGNNTEETMRSARAVAEGLGGSFGVFEIDGLVDAYTHHIAGFEHMVLNWEEHSIPLQNIQARARGPLVWFIANLRGALLVSTSNRSEAAVGYTTMDGDTCGGLSPIGGIDKAFLLHWLKWLADPGNHSFGDFSFLDAVNNLSPSAELKPLYEQQTDEADLMPYIVMDAIERGFVGEKKSPDALVSLLVEKKLAPSIGQASAWVEKFLNLWQRNQWKRERYAPSFHLDDQSLDPKTWCRYPILSGDLCG
jgi:NAD+ synthase (glutamine-hydrolysing)